MSEADQNPFPAPGEPLPEPSEPVCALEKIGPILDMLDGGKDVAMDEVRPNFTGGDIPLKTGTEEREWAVFCKKCGGGALLATTENKEHEDRLERVHIGEAMLERCKNEGLSKKFDVARYAARRRIG